MTNICPECGYPLQGFEEACPECGCPVAGHMPEQASSHAPVQAASQSPQTISETIEITDSQIREHQKTDWAQYLYENGVIGWEAFKKYFCFTGRASRREFWSLCMLNALPVVLIFFNISISSLCTLIFFFPTLGACIRRLHDIGKCGWWSLVPIACFFLYLKKSDEGANRYGMPNPAKNLL